MSISSITQEPKQINNRKKVVAASLAGSAIGIASSVAGIYAMAKKGNPALVLKNLAYQEKDVLLIDFDGKMITYPAKEVDNLRLAYAISIHKSQGSGATRFIVKSYNTY